MESNIILTDPDHVVDYVSTDRNSVVMKSGLILRFKEAKNNSCDCGRCWLFKTDEQGCYMAPCCNRNDGKNGEFIKPNR